MSLSQRTEYSQGFRSSMVLAITLGLVVLSTVALSVYGWRQSILFILGIGLGLTLHHARFGFSSAYRKWWLQRDGRGLLAQCLLLGLATLLFAPVLAIGEVAGETIRGALAPVGIAGMLGAFLFGIGMQLGGGCGCGTLAGFGQGNLSTLVTILTFCLGSFLASLTRPFWAQLPSWPPIAWNESLGWVGGVTLQLTLLGILAGVIICFNRDPLQPEDHSPQKKLVPAHDTDERGLMKIIRGPWSLATGAVVLALLACLTLIVSGQPWRITWGFLVWAAHAAQKLGWQPDQSPFWQSEPAQYALNHSIFADVSSVMNIGLILGAILGAALAGRFTVRLVLSWPDALMRGMGGFMMGFGALLSFGCNVSAFLGGIASLSIHGWLWIVFALFGSWLCLQFQGQLKGE
ncbi:YeeE/YedE family protein [Thermosynechococcaceae cyanobacterium BACA0444]|uniref:YeeE/YedE family protein n=1 Tax=Pseudocalidococcus azoricus BACA0444 TaxID=2918990 RepID=A0AAE4JWU6_9CYAN|nr:YeeE/YedE family protein [Pseudocalidococcus azoricus]MDS3861416.1 YeeE/YedE family protein [Pseudocalidococcus azoricus BACA0444]